MNITKSAFLGQTVGDMRGDKPIFRVVGGIPPPVPPTRGNPAHMCTPSIKGLIYRIYKEITLKAKVKIKFMCTKTGLLKMKLKMKMKP